MKPHIPFLFSIFFFLFASQNLITKVAAHVSSGIQPPPHVLRATEVLAGASASASGSTAHQHEVALGNFCGDRKDTAVHRVHARIDREHGCRSGNGTRTQLGC